MQVSFDESLYIIPVGHRQSLVVAPIDTHICEQPPLSSVHIWWEIFSGALAVIGISSGYLVMKDGLSICICEIGLSLVFADQNNDRSFVLVQNRLEPMMAIEEG